MLHPTLTVKPIAVFQANHAYSGCVLAGAHDSALRLKRNSASAIMVKVDIMVFTGGIGQYGVKMRELICKNLENIGIVLDKNKNRLVEDHIGIISADYSPVTIMVIPTDEEKRMAEDAYKLIFE